MKRRIITRAAVCAVAAVILAAPVLAIFGLGDIVFDPTNYEEAIQQLVQMQQQYMQLVNTYNMVRAQYDHLLWMAKRVPVDMASRYRAVPTPWRMSSATNTYGTTSGWIAAINTGSGVSAGYARATQSLAAYGGALTNVPADQVDRIKTDYATAELTDGANLHGIETIGTLRANAPAIEATIQALENDSLSADPDMNTEIAVLNKINAAGVISLRNSQDTNKLLVALAEQAIIDAKRTRDAEAQAINQHIRFMAEGRAIMNAQASGASAAMLAWRMP